MRDFAPSAPTRSLKPSAQSICVCAKRRVPLPEGDNDEVQGEAAKGRLYPRTKDETRAGLREILQRDKPKALDKEVHEAICRLNAYRFLSGVFSGVGTESLMVEGADDAAKACAEAKTISHSLGAFDGQVQPDTPPCGA